MKNDSYQFISRYLHYYHLVVYRRRLLFCFGVCARTAMISNFARWQPQYLYGLRKIIHRSRTVVSNEIREHQHDRRVYQERIDHLCGADMFKHWLAFHVKFDTANDDRYPVRVFQRSSSVSQKILRDLWVLINIAHAVDSATLNMEYVLIRSVLYVPRYTPILFLRYNTLFYLWKYCCNLLVTVVFITVTGTYIY